MFKLVYDLLVWLTNNYSKMPDDFKNRFPESFLVRGRIDIGSISRMVYENWIDYE